MKIAIKGNASRGEEVIQILESLGGKNIKKWHGTGDIRDGFFIDSDGIIEFDNLPKGYKLYTIEEFEKEFPFKIGDKVIHKEFNDLFEVIAFNPELTYPYKIKGVCEFNTKSYVLTKWQPKMKEERFVTLALDKAKEWYDKGGELREIALQAFTEKELNPLPRSWEEFCEKYPVKRGECILEYNTTGNRIYKNWIPSQKSAEAHLAMIQLEQLRDCYRGLFITIIGMPVWCIIRQRGELVISQRTWGANETFLSFQSLKVAKEYLDNFKPLIEKAGDLI